MACVLRAELKLLLIFAWYPISSLSDPNVNSLPFCDFDDSQRKHLILVNTLDGKITALDPENDGDIVWNMTTSPGHMLSSSIHQLKLYNQGNPVEVIPSLSGSLYKYNGKNVEPIPVAVSSLLKSSYQYTDRYSGSEESRQYGIAADTGELLYECSVDKCGNYTHTGDKNLDILEIRRFTQTVRGFKPRSGEERWNFSVAQVDMKLLPDPSGTTQCILQDHELRNSSLNLQFKAVVPEGIVCAVDNLDAEKFVWKQKFESPVVNMWRLHRGKLERIELFEDKLSLYLGTYKDQFYIQESIMLQAAVRDTIPHYESEVIKVGAGYTKITLEPATEARLSGYSSVLQITDQSSSTALSVLYAPDINKTGFYSFLSENPKDKSSDKEGNISIITEQYCENEEDDEVEFLSEDDEVVQIIIVSIWYWWKEITLISLATAVAVNFIINWQCMRNFFFRYLLSDNAANYQSNTSLLPFIDKRDSNTSIEKSVREEIPANILPMENYISRYLTDFDPIHCLGKGGFGVVFEAKNKIDDCHYAIKRISLPNKQESRDRVMREVKALAKLDHRNIVRYFNAWVECPPAGWQEDQDKIWCQKENQLIGDATSLDLDSNFTPVKPPRNKRNKNNVKFRKKPRKWLQSTQKSFDTSSESSLRIKNDKSDSFIVFEASEKEEDAGDKKALVKQNTLSATSEDINSTRLSKAKKETTNVNIVNKSSRIFLYIQMQLCRKESLREWLCDNTQPRNLDEILNIFQQIVQAVEYVHLEGLIHRDLKPSNIFFSPNGEIKIGDFGLVTAMDSSFPDGQFSGGQKVFDERHTACVGTQLYMSPEQVEGLPYNYKVDIYSLGLILFELLVPFSTQMERWKTMTDLRKNVFPSDFKSKFKNEFNILHLMLSHLPEKRPTTFGIRALYVDKPKNGFVPSQKVSDNWHFELPARHRTQSFNHSSSNSENSTNDFNEFGNEPGR